MVDLVEFCSGLVEPHSILYRQQELTVRLVESRAGMQGSVGIRLLMRRKSCADFSLRERGEPRDSRSNRWDYGLLLLFFCRREAISL